MAKNPQKINHLTGSCKVAMVWLVWWAGLVGLVGWFGWFGGLVADVLCV